MDRNKTIAVIVCTCVLCGTFLCRLYIKDKGEELKMRIYDQYTYCISSVMEESRLNANPCHLDKAERICDKELKIVIYDQYTYCIRSVMKESRLNSKPCNADEAERICGKLRQHD